MNYCMYFDKRCLCNKFNFINVTLAKLHFQDKFKYISNLSTYFLPPVSYFILGFIFTWLNFMTGKIINNLLYNMLKNDKSSLYLKFVGDKSIFHNFF